MSGPAAFRSRPFALAVLLLTLAWLWMCEGLTVVARADAELDDALFVRQALHLSAGAWLGPYDELTLAKGPGYPLFLAACVVLGLSVPLAQRLLYAAACLLAARALQPLARSRAAAFAVYAVLLLQPASTRNLTREGIYPALSLLVVALAVALLLRPEAAAPKVAFGAGLLGAALGALWITREEGVWLLPSLGLGALALVAAWALRLGPTRPLGVRLAALGAAPVAFAGVLFATALANRAAYGVAARVEVVSPPFTRAYGALSRILVPEPVPFVPVPRAAREAAYAVSPAFRELRADLEGPFGARWRSYGCGEFPGGCADIAGGWFQWALRGAAARAGHHRSATGARDYYARLAAEVDAACDAGRIPCGPPRATPAPVGLPAAVRTILRRPVATLAASLETLGEVRHATSERPSTGRPEQIARFADVASSRLAPPSRGETVTVTGWAFAGAPGAVLPGLESGGRPVHEAALEWFASPDLVAHFDDPARGTARFELRGPCEEPCAVVFRVAGDVAGRAPVAAPGGFAPATAEGVEAWIDRVELPSTRSEGPRARLDAARLGLYRTLAGATKATLPAATGISAAAALAALVLALRRRGNLLPVVAAALVAGAVVARVVLVSAIHLTSFPAVRLAYLLPAVPLAVLFVAVAALAAAPEIRAMAAPGLPGPSAARRPRPSA